MDSGTRTNPEPAGPPSRTPGRSFAAWLWGLAALWFGAHALLLSRHYFFLFDDFALIDQAAGTSVSGILNSPLFGFYRPAVFLLVKALASFFSWGSPMGYALVLAAVHALNGVLLGLVLRSLNRPGAAALAASALFLFSPWSSEAYGWLSALFDSTALLFLLLAVLSYARFLIRKSKVGLAVAAALFFAALLSKENMVVFLPVFLLARAALGRSRLSRRAGPDLLLFLGVAAGYLAVRGPIVGVLGGSYGDLRGLFSGADLPGNLGRYVLSLVWVGGKSFPQALGLSILFVSFAVAAVVRAFVRQPLAAAALSLMLLVSLGPVLWNSTRLTTSDAGRLLYAPGAFFCILVGIGLEGPEPTGARGRRPWSRLAVAVLVLFGLAGAAASSAYQAGIWKSACGLSRRTVAYVLRRAQGTEKDIRIQNLPFLFIEGPYILKSYGFSIYARHRFGWELPPVRSDVVHLSYRDTRLVSPCGPEPGGLAANPGRERREELVLVLPLDDLRRKTPY